MAALILLFIWYFDLKLKTNEIVNKHELLKTVIKDITWESYFLITQLILHFYYKLHQPSRSLTYNIAEIWRLLVRGGSNYLDSKVQYAEEKRMKSQE